MQITIHPSPQGARSSITPSSSGGDKKGRGGTSQDRDVPRGCCSSTSLRAIGRAISRELQELGTSIRARAARIATSRTSAQAFVEAFSVIPPSQVQTRHVQRTGFDSVETIQSQCAIAKKLNLPTSFTQVRDGKSAPNPSLTRSSIPEVLTIESLRQASPAVLDKFLEFSLEERSAENLFFLIAAEQLLSSSGLQKRYCAMRMKHGFTNQNAPLEPNFSGKTKSLVQSLLNDLADDRDRPDLAMVIEQATRNLLQSFGTDAYQRWRPTLPN